MRVSSSEPMMELVEQWARHFGWYTNRIDRDVTDLGSFATQDCTLTAHPPVWGSRPGSEHARPIAEVRNQLARVLRVGRPARNDMHLALHPDRNALCLFVRVKIRVALLPLTLRTVPLAFVVHAADTDAGPRIDDVHEWAADSPDDARRILIEHHSWPADTLLHAQVEFGASS